MKVRGEREKESEGGVRARQTEEGGGGRKQERVGG